MVLFLDQEVELKDIHIPECITVYLTGHHSCSIKGGLRKLLNEAGSEKLAES